MPAEALKTLEIIMDSNLTLEQALVGKEVPEEIKKTLEIMNVDYLSFDGNLHRGQMVVKRELVKDLEDIFAELFKMGFPINKMVPISEYNWNDTSSMEDNNSSAFNYRNIAGKDKLSNHALGVAVDINPFQNPCIQNGIIEPSGAEFDLNKPGTITGEVVEIFTSRGWTWGGGWESLKDYHHFEKVV